MIPIAVLVAVAREPIVEILFGNGRISAADLDIIAVTLTAFLIGLTAHALIAVLARAFYARQDTVTPVVAAVGAVVVNSHAGRHPGRAARAARHRPGHRHRGLGRGDRPARDPAARRLAHFGRGRHGPGRQSSRSPEARVAGVGRLVAPGSRRRRARPRPRPARPARRDRPSSAPPSAAVYALVSARLADPRTAVYRRGHGRRVSPSGAVVTAADTAGVGRVRRGQRARFVPSAQRVGHRQGRRTAGRRTGSSPSRGRTARSAPRSSSGGLGRCPGGSPTRLAGPWPRPGQRTAIEAFTSAIREGLPRDAGRVSHVRIDPEIEADGPLDPDGSLRRALRVAGWRPAAPIQPNATRIIDLRADEAALWGDLRKKWRQYVNKARSGGIEVVDADGDRLDDFYRVYRETADRAGFLIRAESAYRDVWDAFAPAGQRPAAVRPATGRRALGDAASRALRSAGRGAVWRDDRRRWRVAGELPAQVGGHPVIEGARRDELRPVGSRDRRHRPFQDRVRWPRGPLHRGVGPRPRSARSTGLRGRPAWPGVVGPAAGRIAAAGATPRPSVAPIEHPRGARRRACDLGRPSGRCAGRSCVPIEGVGRPSRGSGWRRELPRHR